MKWLELETTVSLKILPSTLQTPKKKRNTTASPPLLKSKSSSPFRKDQCQRKRVKKFDIGAVEIGAHDCDESRDSFSTREGGRGDGSSGKWLDKITPKKNWTCIGVEDLGIAGATCEMCERERIRYVHTMYHADDKDKVGCICAGHLSGDNMLSKERQSKLEQRLKRRENFPKLKNWKVSRNGNDYIVFNRKGKQYWVVITRPGGKYSAMIEDKSSNSSKEFINKFCNTKAEAKLAAFDHFFPPMLKFEGDEEDPSYDFDYKEVL